MSRTRISRALRQQVIADFQGRCAYCHTLTAITGARLVIDHIVPESLGGKTMRGNLCLACHACNEFKGMQTQAMDLLTGQWVPLFRPRQDVWSEHFRWSADASRIIGKTATGRGTIMALNLNHADIVEARRRWALVGWHPPQEDL